MNERTNERTSDRASCFVYSSHCRRALFSVCARCSHILCIVNLFIKKSNKIPGTNAECFFVSNMEGDDTLNAPWTDDFARSDLRLRCPFTMLVVGATMSGKTSWVTELMSAEEDGMFDRELGQTYYFYRVRQSGRSEALGGAQFQFEGLPTMQWMRETLGVPRAALTHGEGEKRKTPTVIIDDQGTDITMETANLFTVASHHFRCNIICIVHSLFGKKHRAVRKGGSY